MYTITEFRKNIRKAFNDADSGHEVVIERYGQMYQLVSLVDLPLGGNSFESTPDDIKSIKPIKPEYKPKPIKIPKKDIYKLSEPSDTSKGSSPIKDVQDAQKTISEHVETACPHGYAWGLCKKNSCNLKYLSS